MFNDHLDIFVQAVLFEFARKRLDEGAVVWNYFWFLKSVPEAFNQWMVINYPTPLICVQLVNTFISVVLFGILLGFFYSKFKVITEG